MLAAWALGDGWPPADRVAVGLFEPPLSPPPQAASKKAASVAARMPAKSVRSLRERLVFSAPGAM